MNAASHVSRPWFAYALLASLGLFWGLNWPGMKIALNELPVWWFRAMSVGAGAAGLLIISWASTGRFWPRRGEIGPLLICAVFNILGWHLFTGYGVSLMEAGRASIIAFTMPVWASLLAVWLLGEALTRHRVFGLMLGLAGLAALIGPDLVVFQATPLGALFMLAAAMSWAIGTVLFKRFDWESPVAVAIGWQLFIGAAIFTPGAMMLEPVPDMTALSAETYAALAYLFALPMIYCQWAYFRVVRLLPAPIAAIGTLAVPVVGVFSSALLLGEPAGLREFAAMALICAALFVVLVLPALGARRRSD